LAATDDIDELLEQIRENRRLEAEKQRLTKHRNPYNAYNMRVCDVDLGDAAKYHVRNRAGLRTFGSGYPEVAIQEGLDSLRNSRTKNFDYEKVTLGHQFNSIGATLEVESYTILQLDGEITLANSVDSPMLTNKTTTDDHILVEGGYWDANRDNQASGNGFDFRGADGSDISRIDLYDIRLHDVDDHGIYYYWVWGSYLNHVNVYNVDEDGVYLYHFVDARVRRLTTTSTSDIGFHLYSGSCNSFDCFYMGGSTGSGEPAQIYNDGCDNSQWSNIRVDNPASDGVELTGNAIQNIFHGLTITTATYPADNTKDALVLATGADFNVFEDFYIGKKTQGGAIDWRYGINEGDGEYNIYASGIIRNCQTGTKTGISGNSKFDTSSIIEV